MSLTTQELSAYISEQMRMSHVYQPVMLQVLFEQGGTASIDDIAKALLSYDRSQVEYYAIRTKNMVGRAMRSFGMNEFRQLSDDDPVLAHSPLLRAAQLTLQYAQDHGSIGLTPNKAFKRVFVHWAAEHFDWPGMGFEELFRVNKVLNEYDFPPLELLHFLLLELKLGRHYKGEFKITKRGAELLAHPAQLLNALVPFYVMNMDHSSYSRSGDQAVGNWDVWFNVLNVEAEDGGTEVELYEVFYGKLSDDPMAWRATSSFYCCVLRPLCWAGLLSSHQAQDERRAEAAYFKTPLWRAWLKLDTDDMVKAAQRH